MKFYKVRLFLALVPNSQLVPSGSSYRDFAISVSSLRCQKESIYDNSDFFSCPGPQDPSSAIHCCGNKIARFCCSDPAFGDPEFIAKK